MEKKGITLAVGVVAIGCLFGAYAALKSYNNETEEVSSESEQSAILTVNSDEIIGVSFYAGDVEAVFQREDGVWKLEGDDTFPVKDSAVEELLEKLSALSAVRTLEDAEDSSEYGMEEPQNIITLAEADGTEKKVTIGSTNSTTGDDYLMLDDAPNVIYTVSSDLRTSISDDPYDYAVSETLPTILAADINGIAVSSGAEGYEIYRDDDTWCVEDASGTVWNADNDSVNTALSTLASSLSYYDYLEHNCEDGAEYGLDDSAAEFSILYEEEADAADVESEGTEVESETAAGEESGSEVAEETEVESESATEKSEAETEATTVTVQRDLTFYVGDTDASGNYYVQLEGSKEVHTISASSLSPFLEVTAADWKKAETEAETGTESE